MCWLQLAAMLPVPVQELVAEQALRLASALLQLQVSGLVRASGLGLEFVWVLAFGLVLEFVWVLASGWVLVFVWVLASGWVLVSVWVQESVVVSVQAKGLAPGQACWPPLQKGKPVRVAGNCKA